MEDTAINLAHRYVHAAEDHQERHQWEEAVEMHFNAAEQFLLATKDTQDQEVIRTLKFMNANHTRQGRDLQRKLAKAQAEAAAAAAAQQPHSGTSRVKNDKSNHGSNNQLGSSSESPAAGGGGGVRRRAGSGQHQQGNSGGLGQRRHNVLSHRRPSLGDLGSESHHSKGGGGDTGSGGSYLGTSSEASSNSSSAMIEESFTLIKNHVKDESDPFNKFWDAVENLNDLLPMDPNIKQGTKQTSASSSSTASSRTQQPRTRVDPSPMQESFFIIDSPSQRNAARTRSGSASESAVMSASSTKPLSSSVRRSDTSSRGSKTMEEYAIENQQLKMTLDKLSKRNLKLEKQLEGVMQMSVWTKDVQRSAMQLIRSQDILRPVKQSIQDLSAVGALTQRLQQSTSGSQPTSSTSTATTTTIAYEQMNPTTMQARLKELEEELQQLKLENANTNHLMRKYKKRWEDLKESAKRRRNATPTPPEGGSDATPNDSGSPVLNADPPERFGSGSPSSNPYSNAALAGSPSGLGQVARPPFSSLARSSSASGPVLLPGGSYQRRIMMESKAGSGGLDHTPLNMHRQASTGMISSTTPRVLDTSPRTNVGSLSFVTDIPRQPVTATAAAVGSPAHSSPQSPSVQSVTPPGGAGGRR
ncbi:hypothetical protein BGX29_004196, partial [Mortierella sp. GBA35]